MNSDGFYLVEVVKGENTKNRPSIIWIVIRDPIDNTYGLGLAWLRICCK